MDISTPQSKIAAIEHKISSLESDIQEYVALKHPKTKIQLLSENDLQLTQLQQQLTQLQQEKLILLRQQEAQQVHAMDIDNRGEVYINSTREVIKFIRKIYPNLDLENMNTSPRKSVTRREITDDDEKIHMDGVAPCLKFVSRSEECNQGLNALKRQMDGLGTVGSDKKKCVNFLTSVGSPGIGKTTFARKLTEEKKLSIELLALTPYLNDCNSHERRYCIAYSSVSSTDMRNPSYSIAVRLLFEALKYHLPADICFQDFEASCVNSFAPEHTEFGLSSVVEFICQLFKDDNSPAKPLVVINIDETNVLLQEKNFGFFGTILELLGTVIMANKSNCFVVLSGTHASDLYKQVKGSGFNFEGVDLSLLSTDAALDVIYSLANMDIAVNPPSEYLRYILELLGVVVRYLELLVVSMSQIGESVKNRTNSYSTYFTRAGLRYFLESLQYESVYCHHTIKHLETNLRGKYSAYFQRLQYGSFNELIPILTAYTLFERPVRRDMPLTCQTTVTVENLEQEGIVFLIADSNKQTFRMVLPFLTLLTIYRPTPTMPKVSLLSSLDSFLSPQQNEFLTLNIALFRLWFHYETELRTRRNDGKCKFKLSELFPLRHNQQDIQLTCFPNFAAGQCLNQVTKKNVEDFAAGNPDSLGWLNAPNASYGDSFLLTSPKRIIIQDKQSTPAKESAIQGKSPALVKGGSFEKERQKIHDSDVFVFVTDQRARDEGVYGDLDIHLSYTYQGDISNFHKFSGKLIALIRLHALNKLA